MEYVQYITPRFHTSFAFAVPASPVASNNDAVTAANAVLAFFLHCGYFFLYLGDAPLTSCSHCFVLQQTMQILVVKIATRPSLLVIGS